MKLNLTQVFCLRKLKIHDRLCVASFQTLIARHLRNISEGVFISEVGYQCKRWKTLYGFMNDAENNCFTGKQHVLYQFGHGENGQELFISSMASLWMQSDGA